MSGWQLHPRLRADTHPVASLALSEVLLMDDRRYPWLILVPRIPDAVEWIDLDTVDRHRLLDEVGITAAALRATGQPDKLNIGALGNVVSQLHVHVIARSTSDDAWPRPVWGAHPALPYPPDLLSERLHALRGALGASAG